MTFLPFWLFLVISSTSNTAQLKLTLFIDLDGSRGQVKFNYQKWATSFVMTATPSNLPKASHLPQKPHFVGRNPQSLRDPLC